MASGRIDMFLEDAKMVRLIFIVMMSLTFVFSSVGSAAGAEDINESNATEASEGGVISAPVTPRSRIDTVMFADFYLRDGNTVSGRVLSDDKNQIVIEQLVDSTLVTKSYSKREVDTRTFKPRRILEPQYYVGLAEYFAARTWDFVDDPDDFIQAIRSYEKAKQSMLSGGADENRIAEIDKAIKKLEDDRAVWTKEVESRAKLKKLEYDAEAENRLKKLERQIAESNAKLAESIEYLDKSTANMKGDYEQVQKSVTDLNKNLVEQIRILQVQINENRVLINELWDWIHISAVRPSTGGGK